MPFEKGHKTNTKADPEEKKLIGLADSLFRLELSEVSLPEVKVTKNKDWLEYKTKDYFQFLVNLINRDAEHGAIISGKCDFIFGHGLTYKETGDVSIDTKLAKFLSRANRYDSVNDILPGIVSDLEVYNGYPIQFIYGRNGKIVDSYHVPASFIRPSVDGKSFYYCADWSVHNPKNHPTFKQYPAYSPAIKTGSCIYYYIVKTPVANKYASMLPTPNYTGAIAAIETDINIDMFHFTNSDIGMTAAMLLTFFTGNPTDEDKRKLKELFTKNHTGPTKAGSIIFNFQDINSKAVEAVQLNPKDLDKQFDLLGKRVIQKKFTAHRADPVLFGIDTATSWTRSNILEKWEKFKKTYIDLRRPHSLKWLEIVAASNGQDISRVYYEDAPPIGDEIQITEGTLEKVLTTDELRNYIKKTKSVELIEDTDKITRLNLAQKLGAGNLAEMLRIIEGPLPDERKLRLLIKVFGVKEIIARQILELDNPNVSLSGVNIIELFKAKARKLNPDDKILEEVFIDFDSSGKAKLFEESKYVQFADVLTGELRNNILDLLSGGDTKLTPELIAKQLGVEIDVVTDQIKKLTEAKLIESSGKGFALTDKGLKRAENVDPVVETEILTMYKYALSPKANYKNSDEILPTSHEFCKEMIKLSHEGKLWTREDIDAITNEFGMNAWIYRGGYTSDEEGDVKSFCNHIFKAVTVERRLNGRYYLA
jgi:DNA-binding MarR family transcriptional regulator